MPAESRGAALQYFTGSKAHNIALRDRAIGLRLQAERVRAVPRRRRRRAWPARREEDVYEALGLAWVPPELREDRGEIEAAAARARCRASIDRADLRGDLHMHTTETDGKDDDRGDGARPRATPASSTSPSPITASRWRWPTASTSGARSRTPRASARSTASRRRPAAGRHRMRHQADGTLDLADDCLAALDIVVASVHSAFNQDRQQMTDRLLRAIENPHVDILGHPTGRRILQREPYPFDIDAVHRRGRARAASRSRSTARSHRLDLNDVHARLARDRGVRARDLERRAFDARRSACCAGASSSPAARGSSREHVLEHAAVRRVHGALLRRNRTAMTPAQDADRRRQARRDPAALLQDDAADDSATISRRRSIC